MASRLQYPFCKPALNTRMNATPRWHRALASLFLVLAAVVAIPLAQAAPQGASVPGVTAQELDSRYPAGSIQTVEQANTALQAVEQARSSVLARHAAQEAVCYPKFWVSSCLEQAAEVRRAGLALVRRVEVEAARFKRQAKVAEHDKAMEQRRLEDAQNAPQRLIKEQDFQKALAEKEAAQAKAQADEQVATAREEETRQKEALRQQQHDAKLKKLHAQQQADAAKRAEKVAAFEKKQADAKARQAELEQKRLAHEKKAASASAAASGAASAKPK